MNSLGKALRLGSRLLQIGFGNPSRLSHVLGTALAASEEVADKSLDLLRFPQVCVADLLPEQEPEVRLTLALFPKSKAAVSILEFVCLILLMKMAKASSVFEFGTYKGVSITQLALNLPEGSRVLTLDLPADQRVTQFAISILKDKAIAFEKGKGSLVPKELRHRITFLAQDSAEFDETPYAGQVDFVFVDGAHNAEYVRNDSEKGWRMLRSGGIIAWHDCVVADPDVVRYLLQGTYRPSRIVSTALAFAVKP